MMMLSAAVRNPEDLIVKVTSNKLLGKIVVSLALKEGSLSTEVTLEHISRLNVFSDILPKYSSIIYLK
jgi:hypothetical protein